MTLTLPLGTGLYQRSAPAALPYHRARGVSVVPEGHGRSDATPCGAVCGQPTQLSEQHRAFGATQTLRWSCR